MPAPALVAPVILVLLTSAAPAAAAESGSDAPVVLVESAKLTELADTVTYPARVTSGVQAKVYAPGDGVVARIAAPLGRAVRAGTAILTVKNTDPVYEYVPVAVQSPVAGIVSAVSVTEGSRVTKGQELASVTDPAQARFVVEVPAADLATMRAGLAGEVTLPMLGDAAKPFKVSVAGVSPMVDPATGTATAELALVGEAMPPLGVVGKATFIINRRQGMQVPDSAIVYRGKDTMVRIVEKNQAKLIPVKISDSRRGLTEIASGLQDGARVVVRASGFIADGQTVVVQDGDVAKK